MSPINRNLLAAAILSSGLASGAAVAGESWPNNVIGTWNAFGNQSPLTITISTQAASGRCRGISGTIVDVNSGGSSNLLGFYCPASGRYNFVRSDPTSGVTYQDFSGNLSDNGSKLFMGGVFADVTGSAFVGEYSFFASK